MMAALSGTGCTSDILNIWMDQAAPVVDSLSRGQAIESVEDRDRLLEGDRRSLSIKRIGENLVLDVWLGRMDANSVSGVVVGKASRGDVDYILSLVGVATVVRRYPFFEGYFTVSSLHPLLYYYNKQTDKSGHLWGRLNNDAQRVYLDSQWTRATARVIDPVAGHRYVFPHAADKFKGYISQNYAVIKETESGAKWTIELPD